MYTPSHRIEILVRAARREGRQGNPNTAQALPRMAADARPIPTESTPLLDTLPGLATEAAEEERRSGFKREAVPEIDAVHRFALRLASDPDEADDLVQETFLRAYCSWHLYKSGTRIRSWLFTICRNLFLRQKERERSARELLDRTNAGGWPWECSAGEGATDPEAEFFHRTVDDTLLEAIEELPEWYRNAVILADVERLSYEQISTILEIPIGTVKSRAFRGRELLRNRLYDEGWPRSGLSHTHLLHAGSLLAASDEGCGVPMSNETVCVQHRTAAGVR